MDLFDQNELHHAPFTIQNMTFKRKNFIWLNIPLILKTLNTWQTIKCMQSDLSMDVLQNANWKNGCNCKDKDWFVIGEQVDNCKSFRP